jgi:apolipoprotein N-acyltransferase
MMNPIFDIPDLKDLVLKAAIVFGALIVIYGVLWLLATLGVIPVIVAAIFPQIVLIIIGLFIMYTAFEQKKKYY